MFDRAWYKRYFYFCSDPIMDYYRNYANRNPSNFFYTNEYLLLNPDVAKSGIQPLIHYELFGKYEGRPISLVDKQDKLLPNTIKITKELTERKKYNNKIISVFAIYSSKCKIEEYVLYLLKGLNEISDYVLIVSDNYIYEEELNKLDGLCNVYIFDRHGEYDFGSYKKGYNYLIENNILDNNDSLLFINDSNYGPIYPFENIIEDYKNKNCDFYGLSVGREGKKLYIQSFFYIFKSSIFMSECFKTYMNNIKKELSFINVILNYEFTLTSYLLSQGYKYSSFIDFKDFNNVEMENFVPSLYPYTIVKKYQYPLLKRKAVMRNQTYEDIYKTLSIIERDNPELYENYNNKLKIIREKYKNNEPISIVFLVNMTSMFPAESLMKILTNNDKFRISLYVIPDIRFGDKEMFRIYNDTYNELKNKYPYIKHSIHINKANNIILDWYDVINEADIVCYPSPYIVSYSLYNPYYAVQKNILSIHINYGFFRSKYDRIIYNMDNYNNFWKVFLETEINFNEYKIYGQCEATNSIIVGYAKMDKLSDYIKNEKPRDRKRIVIAPHHSVDGGANQSLSLSNFERYATLFLELPQKYPDIDFVFRPHPVLFTVLRKSNKWGDEKVDNYLNKMKSFPNVTYSTEGDYLEIFANSDGIIQDSGSFLVEYFYTFKPCCYMLKSPNDISDKFNELGVKCLEHVYIAYDEKQITNFIENVINNNDYMKEDRIKFAKKEIMINYPNVSKKIYDYLIEVLEGKND